MTITAQRIGILACLGLLLAVLLLAALWRRRSRLQRRALAALHGLLLQERTLRSNAEQTLRTTHASLRHVLLQQQAIKERERWRIARDIHDDLGQHLLALKMDLSIAQARSDLHCPALRQHLALIACNVDLTVRSLRAIINDLRPIALEAGLRRALERQAGEFSRLNGVACELAAAHNVFEDGAVRVLDTMVLRIVQEALANIARHARARQVRIMLRRDGGGLTVSVRDDGVGMPPDPSRRGCGLQGIEDRVRAVGGHFSLDSQPGLGTALLLSIPLAAAAAGAPLPQPASLPAC